MRVLVLGGTGAARAVARAAAEAGHQVTTSLAGRTSAPASVVGAVRSGGFGGAEGLRDYLAAHRIDAVVDATHPFAASMSAHAAGGCAAAGIPLVRLDRPSWADHPAAATWHWVDTHEDAALAADTLGTRVLLTVGRQPLPRYAGLRAGYVVARVAEDTGAPRPAHWIVIADRGPYALDGELQLIDQHRIDVLVSKDSGGPETVAKLDAAARRGVAVVMVRRPPPPAPAPPSVFDVPAVLAWLSENRGPALRRLR